MWGLALVDFGHDPCSSDSLIGIVFAKKTQKIVHKITRSCDFRPS